MKEKSQREYEIDFDHLDLARFPGEAHAERAARFLGAKHAQKPLDLIVTNGRGSLSLLLRYRDLLAPNVPIVYCCVTRSAVASLDLPRDAVGVVTEYDWSATLALAERLQPDAKNLVLISGASETDQVWEADLRKSIQPSLDRYHVRHFAGLPHDDLLRELSSLSRDTIVLLTVVFADRTGRAHIPGEVARDVATASAAPVYSSVPGWLGSGIVGGYQDSFEAQGAAAADMALEIFGGKDPATLPRQTRATQSHVVDAGALRRWGFGESTLPQGAVVAFRQPTVWEQHRDLMLGGLGAFGLQTAVLVVLLVQMRKRRQAELSLQESEERIAYSAASTNIGLWHLDLIDDRGWATEHCRVMLGIASSAPFRPKAFLDAVHAEDRHWAEEAIEQAIRFGTPIDVELRFVVPGHEERWLVMRGQPHVDANGMPVRINGLFADVTARKQAEAEAAMRRGELAHLTRVSLLGELSGAMAHELNQPLTAILSNAQAARLVLREKNPDLALVREVIDDIEAEDNRAGEIIHRLRRLLRKGSSQFAAVNLNDLVKSTVRMLHSELVGRKIKIDVALAENLPDAAGDPVQLQQVLLNLVMNAMDAMNTTAPAQRQITVVTRSNGAGTIETEIVDRGHGISADNRERVFEPFFTTKSQGLGLGLSICSGIVNAHGGTLSIVNNADGGATAVFWLPPQLAKETP